MSDFDLSVQLNEVHKSETDFLEDLSNSVYKKYHVIPYIAEGVGYSNNCIYKPTEQISISGISAEEVIFTRALNQMNIPKAFCTTRRNRQIVILLYLLNNSIVCFEAENSMFVIKKNKELAYQYFRGKVSMEKFCNHFYSTQEELESGQFGCYILSQSSQENIESTFFDIRQPYVISPYETTHKLIEAFQQMIIRNIACVHFVNWNGEHDVVLCTSNSSVLYNVYGMFYDADSMTSGVLINRPDILKMNIIPNKFAGTICVPLQNIISVSYL